MDFFFLGYALCFNFLLVLNFRFDEGLLYCVKSALFLH